MTRFKTRYIILIVAIAMLFFAIPLPFLVDNSWSEKIIEINSADQLFDMANNFSSMPVGECNFKLMTDIDLDGKTWQGTGSTAFKGVFDGNGHTIKNVKLVSESNNSEQTFAFFTSLENAFVHDIIFDNVMVDASVHNPLTANGVRANFGLIGKATGGKIQNITLKNSKINITAGQVIAGGIICQDYMSGLRVHLNLENNNFDLKSMTKETIFGGVSAMVDSDEISYKTCSARDNIKVFQSGSRTAIVGGIIGKIDGEFIKLRKLNCSSVIEVTAHSAKTGGLVGEKKEDIVFNVTDSFIFDGKITQNSIND